MSEIRPVQLRRLVSRNLIPCLLSPSGQPDTEHQSEILDRVLVSAGSRGERRWKVSLISAIEKLVRFNGESGTLSSAFCRKRLPGLALFECGVALP